MSQQPYLEENCLPLHIRPTVLFNINDGYVTLTSLLFVMPTTMKLGSILASCYFRRCDRNGFVARRLKDQSFHPDRTALDRRFHSGSLDLSRKGHLEAQKHTIQSVARTQLWTTGVCAIEDQLRGRRLF